MEQTSRTSDVVYATFVVFMVAASLTIIALHAFKVGLPKYYPITESWGAGRGPSMGWYMKTLMSLGVGALAALVSLPIFRFGLRSDIGPRAVTAMGIVAILALLAAALYYVWVEGDKWIW
jgi:hypothetical protein